MGLASPSRRLEALQRSVTPHKLKNSFADDPEMQAAIAEFTALLPRRVALMKKLIAEHNVQELRRVVHQMKGSGGGYGFDAITQVATQVDAALTQGAPPEAIDHELDLLITLIRSVEGYQLSRELSHA